jgi:hypothetical protein
MRDALQVIKFTLRDFWDNFVLLVVMNMLWSLAAVLPFIALYLLQGLDWILVLVAVLVLLLPLPIISGALCFVTNQASRGKGVHWAVFLEGIRRYWAKSLVVALVNFVVLALLLANLQFYGVIMQGSWTGLAVAAWAVLGSYWFLTQIFWFPMILELENEKVFLALRNALAMVLLTPAFSVVLAIVILIFVALSVALTVPVLLFTASAFLLLANHATRSRLAFAQKKDYEPGPDRG